MLNIKVVSKVFDNHSLSIVSRKLIVQLATNGWANVSVSPLDAYNPIAKVSKEELMILKPLVEKKLDKVDIEIRHSYPPILTWPDDPNTKLVYIQPWEYNRMPLEWKNTFQNFSDLVVVPSNWVRDVYIMSGINPGKVKVVPNGYDPKVYNQEEVSTNLLDTSKFVFTYVGSAQHRKGIDLLLQAWSQAFVKADNAVLFIKDTPAIYGQTNLLENTIQMQYKTGCGKVIYNEDNLSEEEMAAIYKNSDVIVHPYRGEGFGMHVQEAMACGAMPLITGIGALDDFVTEENGIKLNARRQVIDANDPRFFIGKPGDSYTQMGQHFWVPEVDMGDLINKLRFLYFHHERQSILDRVKNAKLTTWSEAALKLMDVLNELKEKSDVQRMK